MPKQLMTATSTVADDIDSRILALPRPPKVVVCIPAYNEATRIGKVVRETFPFTDQILVCDDGSSDDTANEAEANGGKVIRHHTNLGKGAALRTLLNEVQHLDPDIVVTIDGDGQHSPEDIPTLLQPIIDGSAEVVIGSRFGNGNEIPYYRKIGNSLLTILTNMSVKTGVHDTQSGFRAYSSRVIPVIDITNDGMGVDSEILIKAVRDGFRVTEREVSVNYEGDTSTFNPLSHVLRVIWGLFGEFIELHSQRFPTKMAKVLNIKGRPKKSPADR